MKSLQIFAILFLSITLVSAGIFDFFSQVEEEVLVVKTYTSTTDTICSDGICTLTLWSGIRNVYEDDEWKRIENAKSLKGYYNKVYLKQDLDYEIEIEDFNYTCIKKIKLKSEVSGYIPFKLNGVDFVSPYMEKGEEIELEDICVDNIFAYNFTFGEHSTTIMLQDADSENLDDSNTYRSASNRDRGADDELFLGGEYTGRVNYQVMIKFNLTSIPSTIIEDANLNLYATSNTIDAGESMTYDVHHVYSFPLFNLSNQEWHEGNSTTGEEIANATEISYNKLPNSSEQMNLTPESSFVIDSFSGISQWYSWTIKEMVQKANDNGDLDITIFFNGSDFTGDPGSADDMDFDSKEGSIPSRRPHLNITYMEDLVLDITDPTQGDPKSVNSGDNITLIFNFTEGDVDIDSGVTINNITIGGVQAVVVSAIAELIFLTIDFEDFEGYSEGTQPSPIGNWTQASFDNDNWYVYTGGGESGDTGPTSNYDGYYGMVETSTNYCNDPDEAVLYRSPAINFDSYSFVNISFARNMYGATMGNLSIRENSTGSWLTLWSLDGDQGDSWVVENVQIIGKSGEGNIAIWMACGISFTSDVAVDSVNITGVSGGVSDEFAYVFGSGWNVNVTTPTFADGLKDLFINASYSGSYANDTETNAINYGGEPENCWIEETWGIFIPNGCYYEILNGEVG